MPPFPETRAFLADRLAGAEVDHAALARPLRRCDLARCRGTCCHDGVFLQPDEAEHLRRLVASERKAFDEMLPELPEQVIVYGKTGTHTGPKTAALPTPRSERAVDHPAHFPRTRCVFLDSEARCALQRLAGEQGLSPWHHKPFTCWMHPLSLVERGEGRPSLLTLHDETSDPQQGEGYPGFVCHTHCGKTEPTGDPAHEVLAEELRELGAIAGRDFLAEIRSTDG